MKNGRWFTVWIYRKIFKFFAGPNCVRNILEPDICNPVGQEIITWLAEVLGSSHSNWSLFSRSAQDKEEKLRKFAYCAVQRDVSSDPTKLLTVNAAKDNELPEKMEGLTKIWVELTNRNAPPFLKKTETWIPTWLPTASNSGKNIIEVSYDHSYLHYRFTFSKDGITTRLHETDTAQIYFQLWTKE